ncbi:Flp pilus assembly protein CpaB [Azospirillum picis]|uniref:Pilus assembly protein CpaB n=1 Tax=Azospirillum picis TaxID=488438 RepID=A0ABU0MN75_9PROT|nr:Flp pilus assembly protein CpaB [Azospirillum picis]MBP2301114.1 pilus assembly protein CpaB [Azospirillum picis]MDQ0534924.1 pilus assembly protein CpaB [Azospirillum picis]
MKLGTVFLGIAAVAMAVVGGLMVQAAIGTQAAAPPVDVPQRRIAVAATDLAAGSFLQPMAVRWDSFPENALRPDTLVEGKDNIEALTGSVVREAVKAGEIISRDRLLSPRERGFLAAVLTPGLRAASVAVDEVSGTAGLIFPGDHVDLLLTQDVGEDATGHRLASETILEDLRVLAVDQRTDIQREGTGQPSRVARTVTLEVTAKQAQVISVATGLGRLTLSLRSLARPPGVAATGPANSAQRGEPSVVWATDVSVVTPRPPVAPAPTPEAPALGKPPVPTIIRGASRSTP